MHVFFPTWYIFAYFILHYLTFSARLVSIRVGLGPTPAPAHGRFYTYVLNNIDVVITIIYSQKYVLFEIVHRFLEM